MSEDQIKALREAAEKPNRVQGMVRSIDQWRSMEPLDVVTGSHAECALHDAKNDIEVLWRKVNSQAAEIERLREALELARAVLAQSITAGHNVPGPTPEDIEKALPERECATEGCCNPSTVHFERGGIGSHYCYDCYLKVQAVATSPTAARVE